MDVYNRNIQTLYELFWSIQFTSPFHKISSKTQKNTDDIVFEQNWKNIVQYFETLLNIKNTSNNKEIFITLDEWLSLESQPDIYSFEVFNEFARQVSQVCTTYCTIVEKQLYIYIYIAGTKYFKS